jgi:hypothetical protein
LDRKIGPMEGAHYASDRPRRYGGIQLERG